MSEHLPKALLLTAPGCHHCPGMKIALQKLLDEGLIAELEQVDISQQSDLAAQLGVRSVPWLQLGTFTLIGAQTPQQLRQWAEMAGTAQGVSGYLAHLLKEGDLAAAEELLKTQPEYLNALLPLLENEESPIQVRLGVSALFEAFEGQKALTTILPELIALSVHPDHRLRSDACHFLGLSHSNKAIPPLEQRLTDDHPEVREIAEEALKSISEDGSQD